MAAAFASNDREQQQQPPPQPQPRHLLQPGDATSPPPPPSPHQQQPPSAAVLQSNRNSHRRSLMSTRSHSSRSRSRPTSNVFPLFPSSLSYALVRDFAYPAFHPMHHGPVPESAARGSETPGVDPSRRLSDPPPSWDGGRGQWTAGPWGGDGGALYQQGDQLPSTSFDEYDSDEDVSGKLAKNHRKSKSYAEGFSRGLPTHTKRSSRNQVPGLDSQGFFQAQSNSDDDEEEQANGGTLPSRRYTHSPSPAEDLGAYHHARLSALEPPFSDSSDPSDPQHHLDDGHAHRPTSTSLDESFAGPSLALYNFVPENANELALREGQIIQVGYRHGQGWLVAMDLESGEQGLVPEEYVRLLSEIEGWGEHLEGLEEGEMQDLVEEGNALDALHESDQLRQTTRNPLSTTEPSEWPQHHAGNGNAADLAHRTRHSKAASTSARHT